MANEQHLNILEQGVNAWNDWREQHSQVWPDLTEANLSNRELRKVNFSQPSLSKANLSFANITKADFTTAELSEADLSNVVAYETIFKNANLPSVSFRWAKLNGANLTDANLFRADLSETILHNANLRGANLNQSLLIETNFENADLSGSKVFGVSAWELKLNNAIQSDLVVTRHGKPIITVDNLEVAQFIYLLLYNEKIRDVIDTITSKVVFILGSFLEERKQVLYAIKEKVRIHNYLPVLFDFDGPTNQTTLETVSTLAHLARFVIADLTNARSVLQELQNIVPNLPSVPIQPLLHIPDDEPGMVDFFKRFRSFLEIYRYSDIDGLLTSFGEKVIAPAERLVAKLRKI